jgi:hypothetical protein
MRVVGEWPESGCVPFLPPERPISVIYDTEPGQRPAASTESRRVLRFLP